MHVLLFLSHQQAAALVDWHELSTAHGTLRPCSVAIDDVAADGQLMKAVSAFHGFFGFCDSSLFPVVRFI